MPHSKGFTFRSDKRRGDPVAIGEVVEALLSEGVFARGMPITTLATKWPQLVGEGLAQATEPVSLQDGVLVMRASDGPWGAQATYFVDEIRTRADELLGPGSVTAVRIVVGEQRNRR